VENFLKALREEFYAAISRKTGWGKEELKLEFERAASNALVRIHLERKRNGEKE
jgi:hypothetical protein